MTSKLSPQQTRWVEAALPRVQRLARRLAPQMPHMTVEDLVGAGSEGLVQAVLRYDPECGVPFGPFAHYRIRGAMIDAARRVSPAIRRRTRAMRALEATQSLLERAEQQMPSANATDTRSLRERVSAAADLVAAATTAVLLSRSAPKDPEAVAEAQPNAEENLLDRERRAVLKDEIGALPEADRALYEAIYVEGISMRTYAERIGASASSVSRNHARLVDRLRERLHIRLSG